MDALQIYTEACKDVIYITAVFLPYSFIYSSLYDV